MTYCHITAQLNAHLEEEEKAIQESEKIAEFKSELMRELEDTITDLLGDYQVEEISDICDDYGVNFDQYVKEHLKCMSRIGKLLMRRALRNPKFFYNDQEIAINLVGCFDDGILNAEAESKYQSWLDEQSWDV